MSGKYKINGIRVIPTEDEEQIGLFSWAALSSGRFPALRWMFHIPNGGKRSKSEAARFRAMGVKPGVSDIFLPCARGGFHGLFIELKALDGRPSSKAQIDFVAAMNREGYYAVFCRGAEDAERVIERYLKGELVIREEREGLTL